MNQCMYVCIYLSIYLSRFICEYLYILFNVYSYKKRYPKLSTGLMINKTISKWMKFTKTFCFCHDTLLKFSKSSGKAKNKIKQNKTKQNKKTNCFHSYAYLIFNPTLKNWRYFWCRHFSKENFCPIKEIR